MRRLIISAAVTAAAVLAAAPATAQYRGDHDRSGWDRQDRDGRNWEENDRDDRDGRGWNQHGPSRQAIHQLIRHLDRAESRIERAARRRAISPREYQSLRREAQNIRARLHSAGRDGIGGREYGALRHRIARLEQRVRHERRDRDGRRW